MQVHDPVHCTHAAQLDTTTACYLSSIALLRAPSTAASSVAPLLGHARIASVSSPGPWSALSTHSMSCSAFACTSFRCLARLGARCVLKTWLHAPGLGTGNSYFPLILFLRQWALQATQPDVPQAAGVHSIVRRHRPRAVTRSQILSRRFGLLRAQRLFVLQPVRIESTNPASHSVVETRAFAVPQPSSGIHQPMSPSSPPSVAAELAPGGPSQAGFSSALSTSPRWPVRPSPAPGCCRSVVLVIVTIIVRQRSARRLPADLLSLAQQLRDRRYGGGDGGAFSVSNPGFAIL